MLNYEIANSIYNTMIDLDFLDYSDFKEYETDKLKTELDNLQKDKNYSFLYNAIKQIFMEG